jgi:hypothetical protein
MCTALDQMQEFFDSRATELAEQASAERSFKRVKPLIVTFYSDLLDQTDVMLRKLDAFGTPEGDQGEELQREFRAAMGETRPILVELLAKARDLPTRDLNEFISEAEALTAEAEHEMTQWGDTFKDRFSRFEGALGDERPKECIPPLLHRVPK